jgi:hypothetical protein
MSISTRINDIDPRPPKAPYKRFSKNTYKKELSLTFPVAYR